MRGRALGALLLLLALPAATTAARASTHASCTRPDGGRSLATDAQLTAWLQTKKATGYPGTERSIVTVCSPGGRPHRVLDGVLEVRSAHAVGPVLGFTAGTSSQYAEARTLDVFKADGHQLLGASVEYWPLGQQQPTPGFDGYALNAAGAVAWVETNASGTAGTGETLFAKPAGGGRRILATGSAITRLAFAGDSLSWLDDGSSQSATVG